jgi:hypothetical protein
MYLGTLMTPRTYRSSDKEFGNKLSREIVLSVMKISNFHHKTYNHEYD